MPTNFPNGIASYGVPVLPGDAPITTGSVFFVCNRTGANGSDGNSGKSPTEPLATVDYAIGLCAASAGDVIYVLPGHAETVTSTSIALDIAGVRIIGLGAGRSRPIFTFSTAAATITVTGAGCRWSNCHFVANFLNVAAAFTIGAAKDFQLDNSSFIDTSSILNFLSIVVTGSTANAADGLSVIGNYVVGLATTDGAFISILGNCDRFLASDNHIDKAATNDAGHFMTQAALVMKGARILRNILNVVGATSSAVGVFATGSSTTNTGVLAYNLTTSLDTTGALFITAAIGYAVHENYMSGVVANSGTLFPAADNPA